MPVSFSRALVLVCTGLDVCSPSLLKGEPTSDLFPPSFPDESPDITRPDAGRVIPRLEPIVDVLTVGRVGAPVDLPVVDDTDACLVVLDAGNAGGPMEDLVPAAEGRDLVPALIEETRAFEGVPVRELAALDAAVEPSCFVGDFVGDYVKFFEISIKASIHVGPEVRRFYIPSSYFEMAWEQDLDSGRSNSYVCSQRDQHWRSVDRSQN